MSALADRVALLVDLVRAMPPCAEEFWRATGYDPDGYDACTDGPLEPRRSACAELLARLREAVTAAGATDLIERLAEPPGPLCWGCDDPVPPVHDVVAGHAVCPTDECHEEADMRIEEDSE